MHGKGLDGMAEICVLCLGDWLERDVSPYLPYASAERREHVARFRHASDKSRSLWAELFLRWRIARATGTAPSAVEIGHDERGKPVVWKGGAFSVSLSHSGGYVAIAVGHEAVGVDVEKARKAPLAVADRWFCPEEKESLRRVSEPERARVFFRFWTLKEAALKYTGEGLSGGLETVDCPALSEAARAGADGALAGRNFALADGAIVGVVAHRKDLPESARLFTLTVARTGIYGDADFAESEALLPMETITI